MYVYQWSAAAANISIYIGDISVFCRKTLDSFSLFKNETLTEKYRSVYN